MVIASNFASSIVTLAQTVRTLLVPFETQISDKEIQLNSYIYIYMYMYMFA